MYYVYLFECADKTLYCGITNNLIKREQTHNAGKGSKYIKSHGNGKIIYSEAYDNRSLATKREITIKHMTRKEKLQLLKIHLELN